jgi:hypothetical protein
MKKDKIHFASLFCVDFDLDLLPYWVEHYLSFRFDDYNVWLNTQRNATGKLACAFKYLSDRGFNVTIENGQFVNGSLRAKVMEEYVSTLPKNDYLVTADSDEFQNMNGDYCDLIREYDVVNGILVDRYDDTLHDAEKKSDGSDLFQQFPHEGCVEQEIIFKYLDGDASKWSVVRRSKIMAARAGIPVSFGGSHFAFTHRENIRYTPEHYSVYHFTWRDSLLGRMAGKHYYKAAHLWYVSKFFNIDGIHPDVQKEIDREEQEQKERGWVPA